MNKGDKSTQKAKVVAASPNAAAKSKPKAKTKAKANTMVKAKSAKRS